MDRLKQRLIGPTRWDGKPWPAVIVIAIIVATLGVMHMPKGGVAKAKTGEYASTSRA